MLGYHYTRDMQLFFVIKGGKENDKENRNKKF